MPPENTEETIAQEAPPPAEEKTPTGTETGEGEGQEGNEAEPPRDQPRMIPADVFTKQLGPLRVRNRELENALNEHRRQISEANELIRRLQGGQGTQQHTEVHQNAAPDQDVEQRAVQLNFQRDARRVSEAGMATYGQEIWDGACRLMDGLGLNSPEFVFTCMEVAGTDRTHELFGAIAEDPERAARIAGMTPVRRLVEISRIAEQMTSKPQGSQARPPARTVSRAPDPAPRVNTGTRTAKDWRSDDTSDEEFSKRWEEHMRSRHSAARR